MGTMGHWETALVWAYCNGGYSGDIGRLHWYGRTAMRDIVGTMGHWETALVWAYCNEGYSGDNWYGICVSIFLSSYANRCG